MAAIDQIRVVQYGIPGDEIAPEDFAPDLEDCGAGLSEEALLHWPEFADR